jgi:hypothetical protein
MFYEKFKEWQSNVSFKVEFLMYNRNLPYGQSNVHVSQQEHKSLKYTRAASILLGWCQLWLTKQKDDCSKEKTTNI